MRITAAQVRVICRRLAADSSAIPSKEDDAILCNAVQQGIEADLAMQTMLHHHRGLMHRQIRKYIPDHLADEALTEAMIGMAKAVRKFDPAMGCKFSTYATHWIQSRIRRMSLEQSGMTRVPEYSVYRYRRMRKYMDLYHRDNGEWPDDAELARFLEIDIEQVRELRAIERFETRYLQDLAGNDTADAIIEALDPGPEETVLDLIEVAEVALAIQRQPAERRRVLTLRFGLDGREPMSYREMAADMGCSFANAHERVTNALKALRRELLGVPNTGV